MKKSGLPALEESGRRPYHLNKLGAEPLWMTPAAFSRSIVDETANAERVAKAAGIHVE